MERPRYSASMHPDPPPEGYSHVESEHIENTGSGELYFSALVSPPWREEDDLLV